MPAWSALSGALEWGSCWSLERGLGRWGPPACSSCIGCAIFPCPWACTLCSVSQGLECPLQEGECWEPHMASLGRALTSLESNLFSLHDSGGDLPRWSPPSCCLECSLNSSPAQLCHFRTQGPSTMPASSQHCIQVTLEHRGCSRLNCVPTPYSCIKVLALDTSE